MARWWGKNLKIDGSILSFSEGMPTAQATQWEIQVQDVCRKIEQAPAVGTGKANVTGSLLMRLISAVNGKMITIVPIAAASLEKTGIKTDDQTKAMKSGWRFTCPADQTCSVSPALGSAVTPHSKLLGTGDGVSVKVLYHPESWTAHDQVKGLDTLQDNIQPDDVLFHELFHAYRCMLGLFEEVPTGDSWQYSEEFYAIVATNVYCSELGRTSALRGDHDLEFHAVGKNKSSWGDQAVGRNFYNENFGMVDDLAREMPDFTRPLEGITEGSQVAAWNPFRERILFDKNRGMYNSMGTVLDMLSEPH